MKLYTKRGDAGESDLLGGQSANKSDIRFKALGEIDETSAHLGLLRCGHGLSEAESEFIQSVQSDLVALMAHIAALGSSDLRRFSFPSGLEAALEQRIDKLTGTYGSSPCFTTALNKSAAQADVARTVCRRAERTLVLLAAESEYEHDIDQGCLKYINRLSDYLYAVMVSENEKR